MNRARPDTPEPGVKYHEDTSPLRPIIEETIRTQICRKEPRFIVEKINIVTQRRGTDEREALRLWLSDGEKCIQAVVKGYAHPFILSRDICIGSYVRLLKYELVELPKRNADGIVWVFSVDNLIADGHDGRDWSDYGREEVILEPEQAPADHGKEQAQDEGQQSQVQGRQEEEEEEEMSTTPNDLPEVKPAEDESNGLKELPRPPSVQTSRSVSQFSTPRKRKAPAEGDVLFALDPNVPGSRHRARKRMRKATKVQTPPKKTLEEQTAEMRAKLMAIQSTPTKQRIRAATDTPSPSPLRQVKLSPRPEARKIQTMPAPEPSPSPSPQSIPRPPVITPLADVTGAKATRNKIHDFLAMVTHVNPRLLVRDRFPDSREILIMDKSTMKQVHLTVFVDAAKFLPEPGTIALFRNLTTHEYNGGSLKAYVQRCAGKKWFVSESDGWPWASEASELRQYLKQKPEIWKLPERIWWTDRGANRKPVA